MSLQTMPEAKTLQDCLAHVHRALTVCQPNYILAAQDLELYFRLRLRGWQEPAPEDDPVFAPYGGDHFAFTMLAMLGRQADSLA